MSFFPLRTAASMNSTDAHVGAIISPGYSVARWAAVIAR
jgi:hypothetical protein